MGIVLSPGSCTLYVDGKQKVAQNMLIIYAYAYIISLILYNDVLDDGAGNASITERREQGNCLKRTSILRQEDEEENRHNFYRAPGHTGPDGRMR